MARPNPKFTAKIGLDPVELPIFLNTFDGYLDVDWGLGIESVHDFKFV